MLEKSQIEARLFLDDDAYENWLHLPEGERLAVMERFWRGRDPNPTTVENEVYDEFLRRYAIAQERFTVFNPGALSDRGRILIRYGDPDEVTMDVMPKNRQSFINAVRDLHGKGETEPGTDAWEEDITMPGEAMDQSLKRDLTKIGLGNSLAFGNESEPFEVWNYYMGGTPLLVEYRLNLRDVGLKLIFSDRHGYGAYELVFRSEDFDF
jgi:GWxTD domain-containing protein